MQNNVQNIPPSNHHSLTVQKVNLQAALLKIDLIKDYPQKQAQACNHHFTLLPTQNSQSSQFVASKSRKDQSQVIKNEYKTEFCQEPYSQEAEVQAQQSLRKLYQVVNSDLTVQAQKIQNEQRFSNLEIAENESRLIESAQEDSQQDQTQRFNYKLVKADTLYDLITFPVPKTKMIRCLVKVANNGFFSLQNIYDLYLYQQKRHLLRAEKDKFRFSTHFDVMGKDKSKIQQFAKVKSNFSRTQYKLLQFKKSTQSSERGSKSFQAPFRSSTSKVSPLHPEDQEITEKQDCYLSYEPNFLGLSQQRLILIKSKKNVFKSQRFSDLKNCYQNCEQGRFQKFSTRLAQKSKEGQLVLDLKQQNLQNSSKNMIIEDQHGEAGLMFAKIKEDLYLLDVMHPFNILEAFFLALANLDRKIFNT